MPSARCLIHKEKFFAPCSQMPLLWGLCTSFVSGKDTRKSCEQSDALADAATRSRTWTCGFGGHRAPSGTPLRRGKCFRWVVVDQGTQKVQHYFCVLLGRTLVEWWGGVPPNAMHPSRGSLDSMLTKRSPFFIQITLLLEDARTWVFLSTASLLYCMDRQGVEP